MYPLTEEFCLIGPDCVAGNTLNPENSCKQCLPGESATNWTPLAEGVSCGEGKLCYLEACCNYELNCLGLDCGDDGCGGSCGDCPASSTCEDQICTCEAGYGLHEGMCVQSAAAGDVIITEVMRSPMQVGSPNGAWVELFNTTDADIDINGWTLLDGQGESATIDVGGKLLTPAGSFVVLAANGDPGENGGIPEPVWASWKEPGFAPDISATAVILVAGNESAVVDDIWYDPSFPSAAGESIQLDPLAFDWTANDSGANWCPSKQHYGLGDYGTPGQNNHGCCLPDCDDKECGDDGCGGSCGDCWEFWVCVEPSGYCEKESVDPPIEPDPGSDVVEQADTYFEVVDTDTYSEVIDAGEDSQCTDECDPGEPGKCYGELISLCGKWNEDDTCFTWGPPSFCAEGKACYEGECIDSYSAGEVLITEIMNNPGVVSDFVGEWVELYNPGNEGIDINGWVLRDNGGDSVIIDVPAGLVIPPAGYRVLGVEANFEINGGVDVAWDWSTAPTGFTLGNTTDEVVLEWNGYVIDQVAYDNGVTFPDISGSSMQLNPSAYDHNANDAGANWCPSESQFGAGDNGTPGEPNVEMTCDPPGG